MTDAPARNLFVVLRYADCSAALTLLTEVFGFVEGTSFRDDSGQVMHAEFWAGTTGVMIGPVTDSAYGRQMKQPGEAGGATASLFVVVNDPDTLHTRAAAAGLDIVLPLRDESYGSREFTVRDPEGHIWTFGTYDPKRP